MGLKFKLGVSDWALIFDTQTVYLQCAMNETISYNADGKVKIIITEASIIDELIHLFKNGNNIKQVIQTFSMRDAETQNDDTYSWVYNNLVIDKVSVNSQNNEIGKMNIVLKG